MANQKISISMIKGLSDGRVYSDVDVRSRYIEKELLNKNAIRQSIRNMMTTGKGERVLYPEYGNGIGDSLFEKINKRTKDDIRKEIIRMFSDEPRVTVKNITITPDADNNEIDVSIVYEIPSISETDTITMKVNGTLV